MDKSVKEAARTKLNSDIKRLKKVTRQYDNLKIKEYLLKLPVDSARMAFAYRSCTLDIRSHRHYMYENLLCRACGEGEEDLEHILNKCKKRTGGDTSEVIDSESEELEVITKIIQEIKTFMKD